MTEHAYQDPDHPLNKIRPRVRCIGCGEFGCITAWGNWCFKCNVERMDRINKSMETIRAMLPPHTGAAERSTK